MDNRELIDYRDVLIDRVGKEKGWTMQGDRSFWHEVMDEYFRERALELLEYMAKKRAICIIGTEGPRFLMRGESLTREQVFENFL